MPNYGILIGPSDDPPDDDGAEAADLEAGGRWEEVWEEFNRRGKENAVVLVDMLLDAGFESKLLCDEIGDKLGAVLMEKLADDLYWGRKSQRGGYDD